MIQILFGVEGLLLAPHNDDHESIETRQKNGWALNVRVWRDRKVWRNGGILAVLWNQTGSVVADDSFVC